METSLKARLTDFIEQHVPQFHDKRLQSLDGLKLKTVLKRKNPYLFKAKHVESAPVLVEQLLDAHLSSQEETIFGDFLESLAIHVCSLVYDGRKSTSEGIDLEFDRDGARYIVSIKSGPNWGNSSQIKKMRDHFKQARRIYGASRHMITVNGCCYGRDNKPDKGEYLKLCGQSFWELISGSPEMYQDLIEPLGHQARARNEAFSTAYAKVINRFSADFIQEFCLPDGAIDWHKLVAFNSSKIPRG
ncbi:MAG: PmeII family type II restriction endonuclease [Thiomonas sp.]|uniref:PmeII family type II restriction endonuclease n=1 Tax=Thiomonas sp. TaxID=2047785 RepID=UPI002A35AF3E|nr:PmeII family type II restriction endonuclease [Thiomonas sp.]MDY0329220.1 PmeII family type II restriction endonuclease [Thiomonas sp.]